MRTLSATLLTAACIATAQAAPDACVPVGQWIVPGDGPRATSDWIGTLAQRRVILLGEGHDIPEHHRWQMQTIAALHAQRPELVLGFEMFPRAVQPVLDRWVAGQLSEAELLRDTDWKRIWGFDAQMYLPIFHFARMNRIPMVALNIDPALAREIGASGLAAVPAERRQGISDPAAPLPDYESFVFDSYSQHGRGDDMPPPLRSDAKFRRFLEAQLIWDRAMAEGIAAVTAKHPDATIVALMGSGHVINRWGVPHQLEALSVHDAAVLLPWEPENDCAKLTPGYADAVFGLGPRVEPPPTRPKLGLWLEPVTGGVAIRDIEKGGLGELAGLRQGDVLVEVAGRITRLPVDVSEAVQRQAPGTWLPMKVQRDGRLLEIIAKFPPSPS
ncbi:MAG: ChaN family lipoprotein [Burkholderiales bacterium]|nr:ChaN family lipoprotein [Burkholderiales bacterium]